MPDRAERPWHGHLDHDQGNEQCRPKTYGLARAQDQEDDAYDDQHDDSGTRDRRGARDDQGDCTKDPAPLTIPLGEVDREWHEHHQCGAQSNRVLSRAEDAERAGAISQESPRLNNRLRPEKRHHVIQCG